MKARGIRKTRVGRSQGKPCVAGRRQAFSLIELTVVLALVAILATLVVTSSSIYSRFLVRAEVDKLYAVCSYVKQLAQVTGRPETVSFSVESDSYSYENVQEQLAPQVVFGAVAGAKGPPSSPRNSISKAVTFPNNQIIFHPTGIMQAGTVYMASADGKSGYALSCAVSQVSFLRRYVYDGAWRLIK